MEEKESTENNCSEERNESEKPVINAALSKITGICGLEPKSKKNVNNKLSNFGFIPRKKARDATGELSSQIRNIIIDPEQQAPIVCDVSAENDDQILKEFNHNPKNILGRQRIVSNNLVSEKRDYNNEQSTISMVKAAVTAYPSIFSIQGKTQLHCDICYKTFKSAKMSHVNNHIETELHKNNFRKRDKSQNQLVRQRDFIKDYFDATRAKGESLELATLLFRFNTVKEFLRNGVPILKIDGYVIILFNLIMLSLIIFFIYVLIIVIVLGII